MLIGLTRLRAWVLLLSMSTLAGDASDASLALLRGYTCEQLARRARGTSRRADLDPDAAFALGLLDGITTLLGITPQALLDGVPPLDPQITAALTGEPNALGTLLEAVCAYDDDDVAGVERTGYALDVVAECYVAALSWTTRTMASAQNNGRDLDSRQTGHLSVTPP